jgi:hypothetical protein
MMVARCASTVRRLMPRRPATSLLGEAGDDQRHHVALAPRQRGKPHRGRGARGRPLGGARGLPQRCASRYACASAKMRNRRLTAVGIILLSIGANRRSYLIARTSHEIPGEWQSSVIFRKNSIGPRRAIAMAANQSLRIGVSRTPC